MPKYRKKPVTIEAWQFTKKNYKEGAPAFIRNSGFAVTLYSQFGGKRIGGSIDTLEGEMQISENDFIIKGVHGEFYPCKPDIFLETYDLVED